MATPPLVAARSRAGKWWWPPPVRSGDMRVFLACAMVCVRARACVCVCSCACVRRVCVWCVCRHCLGDTAYGALELTLECAVVVLAACSSVVTFLSLWPPLFRVCAGAFDVVGRAHTTHARDIIRRPSRGVGDGRRLYLPVSCRLLAPRHPALQHTATFTAGARQPPLLSPVTGRAPNRRAPSKAGYHRHGYDVRTSA